MIQHTVYFTSSLHLRKNKRQRQRPAGPWPTPTTKRKRNTTEGAGPPRQKNKSRAGRSPKRQKTNTNHNRQPQPPTNTKCGVRKPEKRSQKQHQRQRPNSAPNAKSNQMLRCNKHSTATSCIGVGEGRGLLVGNKPLVWTPGSTPCHEVSPSQMVQDPGDKRMYNVTNINSKTRNTINSQLICV